MYLFNKIEFISIFGLVFCRNVGLVDRQSTPMLLEKWLNIINMTILGSY